MADALAISAAVVQFLDIAIKLTLQLSSLYKEIRDVPEKLQRVKADIDQQIAIAKYVQSSHAMFWNGSPATSAVSMPLDQPLADYVAVMEQLLLAVQTIAKSDAGIVRRSWNALRATQKCKEAITLCDALEKKKSNITMWLSTANMELSAGIKRLVEGVETKVDMKLQLIQKLEGASMKQDQQLSRIPALFDLSINTHSAITDLNNDTSSSQQQLLTFAANTDTHIRKIVEQWQELSPTLHEFRDIVQQSSYLRQTIRQVALKTEGSIVQRGIIDEPDAVSSTNISRRKNACTCREITRATGSEPLSFLHFRKVFRQYHYRDCPRSRSSATSLEYLVKIVPPSWLLSQTINLGFCISYWNSKSSWKISPLVVGGARLVDPTNSPAFRTIRDVKELDYTESGIQPMHIEEMAQTLRDFLSSHQTSVYDEDRLGSTILYAVLDLYLNRSIIRPNYDPCTQEFLSLIQFLLELGSDPNVHRHPDQSHEDTAGLGMRWQYLGGTLLDIFTVSLICKEEWNDRFLDEKPMRALVYETLFDSGAHFSRPLAAATGTKHPHFQFMQFEDEIRDLRIVEDQHEVCGLNALMVSIIRRSEVDFRKALTKDNIQEASLANGLTAIHFAIYWPWALRELIHAGADVDPEDSLGRRPIHLATGCRQDEAIKILLEADCSLFTPTRSRTLLQETLSQGQESGNTSSWIVHALINRHTRLINLALSVFPDSFNLRRQSRRRSFNDRDAPELIYALAQSGCCVPSSLVVNHGVRGVYDAAGYGAEERLTFALADQLWDGRFHSIDDPSLFSMLTPILQSWYIANFDIVSWFISKGASPFSQSPEVSHSGLHLYAARMTKPGHYFKRQTSNLPCPKDLFKQLTDEASIWHDDCRCLCSPKGCIPISIVMKSGSWRLLDMNYETMLDVSKLLHEKLLYRPEDEPAHIQQLLGAILFEQLSFRHSCCVIGQNGGTEAFVPWEEEECRDFRGLESEYYRRLTKYAFRMLRCRCDTAEKPICAAFREECEKVQ